MSSARRYRAGTKEVILEEDHRWTLLHVVAAQEAGKLPRPVRMIGFDRHTDANPPGELNWDGTLEGMREVCEHQLSRHDDDWIVAGMQLGVLGDVFLFGADDRMGDLPKAVGEYALMGRWEMPAKVSGLGARARELLEWTESPILLDLDLDCFAYPYRDLVWAWSEEMFAVEFGPSLPYFRQWRERAGLVTVCREAGCCGGEENADRIWHLVGRYLFEKKLH
jgi:hypothetical protein